MNLNNNQKLNSRFLINPKPLWAIENELIDIPVQYRDDYWKELLVGFIFENAQQES